MLHLEGKLKGFTYGIVFKHRTAQDQTIGSADLQDGVHFCKIHHAIAIGIAGGKECRCRQALIRTIGGAAARRGSKTTAAKLILGIAGRMVMLPGNEFQPGNAQRM